MEDFKHNGVTINADQQVYIDKNWSDMDLLALVRHVFEDEKLDGRCKEGRAVREYLRQKDYKYKTTKFEKRKKIKLTEEQIETVINHAAIMSPMHIARLIFEDESLHQVSNEAKAVAEVIKEANPSLIKNFDEYSSAEYKPPKTIKKAIQKINESAFLELDEKKINNKTLQWVKSLLKYLNNTRFIHTINEYQYAAERALFETQFVAQTWDKPDLTVEEINLFINLCKEYIIQARIERAVSKLNRMLDEITEDTNGKISMSLSDAIKTKTEEHNSSVGRQQKLSKDLTGTRSEREKNKVAANRSLVSLVEAMQQKDEREQLVQFAEQRKLLMKKELEAMETFDEFTVRIFGIDTEEVLN